MQALAAARKAGVTVAIEGESLALEHEGAIPDSIIAGLKQHKAEILSLLRPGESVTPALVCRQEPPFGSSGASSQINTAAARHVARIAEKEAELVNLFCERVRLIGQTFGKRSQTAPLPQICTGTGGVLMITCQGESCVGDSPGDCKKLADQCSGAGGIRSATP